MGKLMLWTIPRSKSTVLLKSFSCHPEISCIFEPFAFAHYSAFYDNQFGYEDLQKVLNQEPFILDNIVWKDIPCLVENLDFQKWVSDKSFCHALLVRDPRQVAVSLVMANGNPVMWKDLPKIIPLTGKTTIEENFRGMIKLRDYLSTNGFTFKVFDSTYLNEESCEQFVKSLCEFGDLPFDKKSMLEMKSFESYPNHWWTAPTIKLMKKNPIINLDFHSPALNSTEFFSRQPHQKLVNLTAEDEVELKEITSRCLPLYENLIG